MSHQLYGAFVEDDARAGSRHLRQLAHKLEDRLPRMLEDARQVDHIHDEDDFPGDAQIDGRYEMNDPRVSRKGNWTISDVHFIGRFVQ